ncbi:MAG: exodeoxyribonuclease VII large subunit [bacterium]|nr:exodeoxyribonuclease VII large subunit [bacterium]
MSLLSELRTWRNDQARAEGVEVFRVLPNATLEALVGTLPKNKEEMLAIKGIKEAKYRKYGKMILQIIADSSQQLTANIKETTNIFEKEEAGEFVSEKKEKENKEEDQTLSVSQFLDGLNVELSGMAARVQGEVSSVDVRERVVYFTLKDSQDDSTLNCLIFRYQYEVSGVQITAGDEIVVEGVPDIYKPSGRLSLKVGIIELFGEGALKKAYEALKVKLEQEGLFVPERKRPLPEFPETIALITSEQGAAIGDFTMNLGAQGLKVDFYPVSVEGKKAVFEIIKALKYFNQYAEKYDVLVIVRGGGSLESLQAFNNEALVREVAMLRIPTLLGIGHEKDITLAALVADRMVSTPTATAKELRLHFDEARQLVRHFEVHLPALFRQKLSDVRNVLASDSETLLRHLHNFREMVATLRQDLVERLFLIQAAVEQKIESLRQGKKNLENGFGAIFERVTERIKHSGERLEQYDPTRVLKLGYSLVRKGTQVVKNISDLQIGDILNIQLSEGKVDTKVEKIIKAVQ